MIKYYEVVEICIGGIVNELAHYRGYNLESANYIFEKNGGELELREYEFDKEYEIDFENNDFIDIYFNGGLKCGYDILKRKEEK